MTSPTFVALPTLITTIIIIIISSTARTAGGYELLVMNSAGGSEGGRRFDREIGRSGAAEMLRSGTQFIWKTFRQQSPAQRKNVPKISLVVENIGGIAFTTGGVIHLSAEYVETYDSNLKREIRGVLYHELTHVWQWDGRGTAPSALIEGIADYVKLIAGLASSHWVGPGAGSRWDEGYDITAYFLQYCEGLRPGFVATMNAKLARGWSVAFFSDILGKSVEVVWGDYKAKYASAP